MKDDLLIYKIGIGLIPGIGTVNAKNIIAYTGSIEGVFKEKKSKLLKIPGIGKILADKIILNRDVLNKAEKEIEFIEKHNIKTSFFLDKNYPELLKHTPDAPLLLFSKGDIDYNNRKIISIVGTRNATPRGKENCEKLIKSLAENGHNPIIISGLAYGIDVCAHKSALDNNLQTVAVLGHGFERIYPSAHKNIANEIAAKGAIITEYINDSRFERQNFLQRNRIIAGLSQATIIVESGIKGGSLVTADIANSYNRDVFAFPGRINDKYSVGCNKLIKNHKAALIENIHDIEYILGWEKTKEQKVFQKQLFIELNGNEKIIAKILKEEKNPVIDLICKKSNLSMGKVSAALLNMEFKGAVKSFPGKVYRLAGYIELN